MFVSILQRLEPILKKLYRKFVPPPPPHLSPVPPQAGDRDIEYSWIAANMPEGPGNALDFGSGQSYMGLIAARKGFNTIALDLEPVRWFYKHPRFKFIQGDILKLQFPPSYFDLIINCSAIEHVGLAGRYGVTKDRPDGDIEAMKILKIILKPGGKMLLTIPVGQDNVFKPLHRVYGKERLPRLLEGWEILKEEYWIKDEEGYWICVDKETALGREIVHPSLYGLGLFVLQKPIGDKKRLNR